MSSEPGVSEFLDIKRVVLQVGAEDVLYFIPLLKLESFKVKKWSDDRLALLVLGDELDQLVSDILEVLRGLVPDKAVSVEIKIEFHPFSCTHAGLTEEGQE